MEILISETKVNKYVFDDTTLLFKRYRKGQLYQTWTIEEQVTKLVGWANKLREKNKRLEYMKQELDAREKLLNIREQILDLSHKVEKHETSA